MTGLTTSDSSQSAAYTYAYNGDRLQRVLNGTAWSYLYSKEDILKVDQGGANPMYLTQGPGIDDVLAETVGSNLNYSYENILSSVLQLAGPTGLVANNYNYDAWGQATNWPALGIDNNPYGYTGREWENAGSYYYRARMYTPGTGRFDSVDKVSLPPQYSYVRNAALLYTDPFGLTRRCAGGTSNPLSDPSHTPIGPGTITQTGPFQFGYPPSVPGGATPYNCMAWGLGIRDAWVTPGPGSSTSPYDVPSQHGGTGISCDSDCPCGSYKMLLINRLNRLASWHVYKLCDTGWSSKYGAGSLCFDIPDPFDDYCRVYAGAPGCSYAYQCYCILNSSGGDPCH